MEELLQCLVDVLLQWVLGSQPTAVTGHIQDAITLGVGHLAVDVPDNFFFNANKHYSVYIDEPLVVLALSSLFERQPRSTRKDWIIRSLRTSRNSAFIFEEVMMLVLMEHFGGKFTALGDIFHFNQSSPLASRKVTLVALRRTAEEGNRQCCLVSWNTGSSDRFGFKAKSPANVVEFLNDPKGKPFLFPQNHMGPDLTCFLQDEQTKELILVVLRAKLRKDIDVGAWQNALTSVLPEFFYTLTVCFSTPESFYNPSSFIPLCFRRMRKDRYMPP